MHQRHTDLGALLVTERKRFNDFIAAVSEPQAIEQLISSTVRNRLVDPVQLRKICLLYTSDAADDIALV